MRLYFGFQYLIHINYKIASATTRPQKCNRYALYEPDTGNEIGKVINGYATDSFNRHNSRTQQKLRKVPALARDYPGFVANRIPYAYDKRSHQYTARRRGRCGKRLIPLWNWAWRTDGAPATPCWSDSMCAFPLCRFLFNGFETLTCPLPIAREYGWRQKIRQHQNRWRILTIIVRGTKSW